jgi:transcriptional regulator with XRE-family HTH domain
MPNGSKRLLQTIAANVVRLRRARGWGQQELAERSRVSLRMIGLIESGQNNVSLAKLGGIADAFQVAFSELVGAEGGPAASRPGKGLRLWQGSRPGTRTELLHSRQAARTVELWKWTIAPGDRYQGEPDLPGFSEAVYVLRGELTLELEQGAQVLRAGDCLAFPSDRPYAFANSGKASLSFIVNVAG